jgi:hypothetical protein
VLGLHEIRRRMDRTSNKKDGKVFGPWVTDFDAMARKTCIRALAPYLPLSPELEAQIASDGRTFTPRPETSEGRTALVPVADDDVPQLEAGASEEDTEDPRGAGSEPTTDGSGEEAEGDTASASAPRETPVEDATGDQPELLGDEPEWGSEKDWSAEQWKAHARRYGVSQADLLRHAEAERQVSDRDGAPVSAFGHLKGREALCRLVRGWVEEQGAS